MALYLFDTNVLIALIWRQHVLHNPAHIWWEALGEQDQWATCPLTECGFVRLSSNPRTGAQHARPFEAIGLLNKFSQDPRHIFWEDDVAVGGTEYPGRAVRGHQQVTDAYLYALCRKRGGTLVTFDKAIKMFASELKDADRVLLLPAN